MVDRDLCSPTFLPLVKSVEPVYSVPWQPHVGLEVRMHSRPAAVTRMRPLLPAAIEIPNHVIKVAKGIKRQQNDRQRHDQLQHTENGELMEGATDIHDHPLQPHYVKTIANGVDDDTRGQHKELAADAPILEASDETKQSIAHALDPAASNESAQQRGKWAMAAEPPLLNLADDAPISDERRRGQPLRYRLEQMARQPDPIYIQAGTQQVETNAWLSQASQL